MENKILGNKKEIISEKINFQDLRKKLSEELFLIDDEESNDAETFSEKRGKVCQNFVSKLFSEKEKFAKIFETEKGSIYFISEDGKSWRFKKEKDLLDDQPILNKIIFISPEEREKYLNLAKSEFFQEHLVAFPGEGNSYIPEQERHPYAIKKASFQEGNFPLEIGVDNFPRVAFEESKEDIRILGHYLPDGSFEKSFASGVHLGSAISKIHK